MRTALVSLVLAATLRAAVPVAAQETHPCARTCLESLATLYVDAVVARDPRRLPLAGDVKFTENGQRLQLGDGLWNTATGPGRYALHVDDVERGQAVWMGTIREADAPAILVVRLAVRSRALTEIETLVIRDRAAAERLDAIGSPRRVLLEAVPDGDRLSRESLVQIANRYFSGIERNDGKGDYPLAPDCARLENGMITAGDAVLVTAPGVLSAPERKAAASPPAPPPASDAPRGPRLGCLEQFQTGMFHYVTRIRDRRFVALDPERGLAFAFAFFDNAAGDARNVTLADGRKVQSGSTVPWTWQIAEVFKIERGLIGPVESVLHGVPYGMGSGWSSYEQAMSSEPRFD
jgi:hypothetical protein